MSAKAADAASNPSHRHQQEPRRHAARTVTGVFTWRPDLDPQVSWSNYNLNVIYDTYIPLLTYKHEGGKAGSEVIPGLARSLPRITDPAGATRSTCERASVTRTASRSGLGFKFAVERMFRIDSGEPGYFYGDIVGAKRFKRTRRGTFRGSLPTTGRG